MSLHEIPGVAVVVGLCAAIVLLHLLNTLMANGALTDAGGIRPRDLRSLPGALLAAHALHFSHAHCAGNLVSLAILSWLLVAATPVGFVAATLGSILGAGGFTLLFGRTGCHAGSSSLLFGYLAANLTLAAVHPAYLGIGAATFLLFGSQIRGVLPGRDQVSFEMHLGGAGGAALAVWGLPAWEQMAWLRSLCRFLIHPTGLGIAALAASLVVLVLGAILLQAAFYEEDTPRRCLR